MKWRNSSEQYGRLSIGLHWLMVLLIGAVYAFIEFRGIFPRGSEPRDMMKTWHFMLGLSVLILAMLRLALYLLEPVPEFLPHSTTWQRALARLMKLALYVLMIAMPLAGWLILSASGKPIPLFGLELPALIGESKPTASLIKEIHETGGTIGYYLIGFHAAAALFHHYVLGDSTLRRMLPGRRD